MARSMAHIGRVSLLGIVALAAMLIFTPAPAAAAGGVYFHGGFYGGGWYHGGWGWGWGPGWYSPYWGPAWGAYYWGPNTGNVKIYTPVKDAQLFIDGGYAGSVAKSKKFPLRPGNHEIALRAPQGQTIYDQRVQVLRGKTTELHPE
jgi:hypothetical protein